jgi:hypothetical protein
VPQNDPIVALELERAADWRIRKLGEDPRDADSAGAAALLQKLADDVRRCVGTPVYGEYGAILNWLGEFDVGEDFAERAHDYRMRIGVSAFPESGEAYLRALIARPRRSPGSEIGRACQTSREIACFAASIRASSRL